MKSRITNPRHRGKDGHLEVMEVMGWDGSSQMEINLFFTTKVVRPTEGQNTGDFLQEN
ncbi:hypothetical protein [Elizabethkingia occulta]|uniref:hypothetical protein n=1 Tax=Elizabethkingia occulta TaxID=1867263 RepID=UPI00398C31E1